MNDLFSAIDPTPTVAQCARDAGMATALAHAEYDAPGWAEAAYRFLVAYAKRCETFISEDVSDASKLDPRFPQPPSDRAWGSVYMRAAKAGVIRIDGTGRSRRRHASVCPKWRSLVLEN